MIRQLMPQEFCLRCLGCCRFLEPDSCWTPRLLKEETGELARRKLLNKEQASSDKIPLRLAAEVDKDFLCLFLNQRLNKCQIYNSRPLECQLYPFLINRQGSKVFLAVDFNCPFLKDNSSTLAFKEYVSFLTTSLNSPYYREILSNNPHLLQVYDGVVNLSELDLAL